ncbi:hypothetical protein ACFQ07_16715, partial [Actinomadura adrarensis]
MSDLREMLTWLREQIQSDKAAALRASSRLPGYSERRGLALNIEQGHTSPVPPVWQGEAWIAPHGEGILAAQHKIELDPSMPAARRDVGAVDGPDT